MNDRVNITLATRDRPGFAFISLSSLLSQVFTSWDLTIFDDSSPSLSSYLEFKLLYQVMRHLDHKVMIMENRDVKPVEAYQQGVEASDSELQQRLEDDVWLEPGYLQYLYDIITDDRDIAAIAGANPNPFKPQQIVTQLTDPINYFIQGPDDYVPIDSQAAIIDSDRTHVVPHLHGLFMFRKSIFEKVGGGNLSLTRLGYGEETDVTLKMHLAGYRVLVCPRARLWHAEALQGGIRGLDEREGERQRRQDYELFQANMAKWIKQYPEELKPYIRRR